MLLTYFITVDLVTIPRITAYVVVEGKVIKVERLNESQLRPHAVRLWRL